jgi:hypothetical protein
MAKVSLVSRPSVAPVPKESDYTFLMTQGLDGLDTASCLYGGQSYHISSRTGASYALARKLKEAGAPDGTVVLVDFWCTRFGSSLSLHGMASRTIRENDGGLHCVKHVPFVWRDKETGE